MIEHPFIVCTAHGIVHRAKTFQEADTYAEKYAREAPGREYQIYSFIQAVKGEVIVTRKAVDDTL